MKFVLRRLSRNVFVVLFCCLILAAELVVAEEWGNMSGRFIYDGHPPEREVFVINRLGVQILDDEFIVNKENRGLANVLVFLERTDTTMPLPIHAKYKKTERDKVTLAIPGMVLKPHVLVLCTTQTLVLRNMDMVGHNAKISLLANVPMSPLLPAGASLEARFDKPERWPCQVSCAIHPWESACLFVTDHPYAALTDENGKFKMKNVPVGEWTFRAWHERAGAISKVTIENELVTWEKGRFQQAIKSGSNSLGTIKVSPALFEK